MKTTVEIPDAIYRQIKATAALRGQTVKAFVLQSLHDKLAAERSGKKRPVGWRSVFGKASKADVADVQRMIDEEFSRIDPEDWK